MPLTKVCEQCSTSVNVKKSVCVCGHTFASVTRQSKLIDEISDIENLDLEEESSEDEEELLEAVTVIGVQQLERLYNNVDPTGDHTGVCSSCGKNSVTPRYQLSCLYNQK